MKHAHNFKDVTDQTFGYLTAVRYTGYKSYFDKRKNREIKRAMWLFRCVCGKEIERTRREITNYKFKNPPSCGCQANVSGNRHGLWRGFGEIPKTYFSHLKKDAKKRNLPMEISIEYLWKLFLKQKRKCVLSGEEICFGTWAPVKRKSFREQTASLDRIDSSRGYVKGNIQWVHKDINIMKNVFDTKTFLRYCTLVNENCCVRIA